MKVNQLPKIMSPSYVIMLTLNCCSLLSRGFFLRGFFPGGIFFLGDFYWGGGFLLGEGLFLPGGFLHAYRALQGPIGRIHGNAQANTNHTCPAMNHFPIVE
jgi:hypothetical protein